MKDDDRKMAAVADAKSPPEEVDDKTFRYTLRKRKTDEVS